MASVVVTEFVAGQAFKHRDKETFHLMFDVVFSNSDVRLGVPYAYSAAVFEIDGARDIYLARNNGWITQFDFDSRAHERIGRDRDDFIGSMKKKSHPGLLDPSKGRQQTVVMELVADAGRQEQGLENFHAFINLGPEVGPVSCFSPISKVNVDQRSRD